MTMESESEKTSVRFSQISRGRLSDNITQNLKNAIFQGHYKSGDRIPTETELAMTFGVSRNLVREAFRNLELTGLIRVQRGKNGGTFVANVDHEPAANVLISLLRLGNARVADVMKVRVEIEPIVAGLAAQTRTEEDLNSLVQYFKKEPQIPGRDYIQWNIMFHRLLAKFTHNLLWDILVNILTDCTERLAIEIAQKGKIAHDRTTHPKLFEQIRAGNAAGARELMRIHLEKMFQLMVIMERGEPIQEDWAKTLSPQKTGSRGGLPYLNNPK